MVTLSAADTTWLGLSSSRASLTVCQCDAYCLAAPVVTFEVRERTPRSEKSTQRRATVLSVYESRWHERYNAVSKPQHSCAPVDFAAVWRTLETSSTWPSADTAAPLTSG